MKKDEKQKRNDDEVKKKDNFVVDDKEEKSEQLIASIANWRYQEAAEKAYAAKTEPSPPPQAITTAATTTTRPSSGGYCYVYQQQQQQQNAMDISAYSSASDRDAAIFKAVRQSLEEFPAVDVHEQHQETSSGGGKAGAQTVGRGGRLPGAYSGTPGAPLRRVRDIRFSLVGATSSEDDDSDGDSSNGHETGLDVESQAAAKREHAAVNYAFENSVNTAMTASTTAAHPFANTLPDTTEEQNGSSNHLAEAKAVSEAFVACEAEEVEMEKLEKKKNDKLQRRQFKMAGLGIILISCLLLAIILGVTLRAKNKKTEVILMSQAPSLETSVAPTASPSLAPTGSLDELLQFLPNHTLQSLKDSSTPQWLASDWLSYHPDLPTMEEWRKTQLFALATFYYAYEGPNWREVIRSKWLVYKKSECFWWSAEFGEFEDEDGYVVAAWPFEVEPCDENGVFQNLYLDGLELSGHDEIHVPPEIALLTSLSVLALTSNNATANLDDMLPSELYQLSSSLHYLNFFDNNLVGTLPTQLGLLTELWALGVHLNANISGTIPTEIGLLTSLNWWSFSNNYISGSIPSEIGLMTNLTQIHLFDNYITGTLPMELCSSKSVAQQVSRIALESNYLSGPIPTQLGQFTGMEELWLLLNQFSGEIPSQLGQLTNATLMYLDSNMLSGEIPKELGGMANLGHLGVSENRLEGPIPSQLGLLSNLTAVWFTGNNLTAEVPLELAELAVNGSLEAILMRNNSLSGTIPDGLCLLGECNYTDWYCYSGLTFDCNGQLCGCDWCNCDFMDNDITSSENNTTTLATLSSKADDST